MDEFIDDFERIISPRNKDKNKNNDLDESFDCLLEYEAEPILPYDSFGSEKTDTTTSSTSTTNRHVPECILSEFCENDMNDEMSCSPTSENGSKKRRSHGSTNLKTIESCDSRIVEIQTLMEQHINKGGIKSDNMYINYRKNKNYVQRKRKKLAESNSRADHNRILVFEQRNYLEEMKVYNIPVVLWLKEAIKDMQNFEINPQKIHMINKYLKEIDITTIENRFKNMELFGHQTGVVITSGKIGSEPHDLEYYRNLSWNTYPGGKLTELYRGLFGPVTGQICEEGNPASSNYVKERFTFKSGPDLVAQNYRFDLDKLDIEVIIKNTLNEDIHTNMINPRFFVMIMHNEKEKGQKMESRCMRIGCWFKSSTDYQNYFMIIHILTNPTKFKGYPKSIVKIMKRNQIETYAFQLNHSQELSSEQKIKLYDTAKKFISGKIRND